MGLFLSERNEQSALRPPRTAPYSFTTRIEGVSLTVHYDAETDHDFRGVFVEPTISAVLAGGVDILAVVDVGFMSTLVDRALDDHATQRRRERLEQRAELAEA